MTEEKSLFTTLKNGWIQRKDDNTLINLNRYASVKLIEVPNEDFPTQHLGYLLGILNDNGSIVDCFHYPCEESLEEGQQEYAKHNAEWDFQRIASLLNQ